VVFPDPGWPVMMMHFGFLLMFLDAQRAAQRAASAAAPPDDSTGRRPLQADVSRRAQARALSFA